MTPDELVQRVSDMDMTFTDAIQLLAQQVADLTQQVAALTPAAPPPPLPVPRRWAERADTQQHNELQAWVAGVNSSYSLTSDYAIPVCWGQHPGVVEELAGIHLAWIDAAIKVQRAMENRTGTDALSVWHDRSLWPCLERLKAITSKYQTMVCANEHVPNTPSTR